MILREIPVRHFAGPLDSEGESELKRENASQALVDALNDAKYTASEAELARARKQVDDAKAATQKAAEQQAAESQSLGYGRTADAQGQYLRQLADAQKLNERVKAVLFSWSTSAGFSNSGVSPDLKSDQRRVLARAQETAREEISGRRTDGWRRVNRISELMQDESFVRDSLK
jgi:hypothetical protein